MSLALRKLCEEAPKKRSRAQILALLPEKNYDDGRTKQCHADECDIEKIMHRFGVTGTISHLVKFEGLYGDFSDFDFHAQSTKLAQGETIFAELPAEIRREFGQDPAAFFAYVNDPANAKDLYKKLPALAAPGEQLQKIEALNADEEAARAKANATPTPTPTPAAPPPPDAA